MITHPRLEEDQYKTWYVKGIRARVHGIHYNESRKFNISIPNKYFSAWVDGWRSVGYNRENNYG